mgnify:FL=1
MVLEDLIRTERIRFFGRTFWSPKYSAFFFNWTGSGFELEFYGDRLLAEFMVLSDFYPTEGNNLPWIAIFADGKQISVIGLEEGRKQYTLYQGKKGLHHLRVVKRSEAVKGSVGLCGIEVQGQLEKLSESKKKWNLEFVGDSITCGFGIETDERGNIFHTSLEDGLSSYASICANLLDAEYHSICISGIPLCQSYREDFCLKLPEYPDFKVPRRAMEECYPYTDYYFQKSNQDTDFPEKWDFKRFVPDAIIVNLGTNDAFRVKASGFDTKEEEYFERRYEEFLKLLRRYNGTSPLILCTLGSMDYYLYDNIIRAVEHYKKSYNDDNIYYMKFGGIYVQEEGMGALDHPGLKTHRRMGEQLANVLKAYLM